MSSPGKNQRDKRQAGGLLQVGWHLSRYRVTNTTCPVPAVPEGGLRTAVSKELDDRSCAMALGVHLSAA
jgi:hypothetical protein